MTALPLFSLDTHTTYWRRAAPSKLSAAARQVYQDAIAGKAILVISYMAIAELCYLLHKLGQASLFAPMLQDFQTLPYYRIDPMDWADLVALPTMPEVPEMHDRLLGLSAKRL